jgi:hypothetical protein
MAVGISVKLPFLRTEEDGPFALNKTMVDAVKQNFKMMVLTAPGERIMDPDFGVGIYALLFENFASEVGEEARSRIYSQVSRYMPFIQVRSVNFSGEGTQDENKLIIAINYYIKPLGQEDNLFLNANEGRI